MDISIVGIGNVGGAFAAALTRAGENVRLLIVRDRTLAQKVRRKFGLESAIRTWARVGSIGSEVILICTDDNEIENAASQLRPFVRNGQTILHTSGSLTSQVLSQLEQLGCETGSIHPLVALSDPIRGVERFSGAYFCIEGSRRAVAVGKRLAKKVDGCPFSISTDKKVLYHAAAVMSAGHLVALFDSAVEMMRLCGIPDKTAKDILLPLSQSALANLVDQRSSEALTGTFARFDVEGLERHIKALKEVPEEFRDIYLDLGEHALTIMEQRGTNDSRLAAMRSVIFMAKRKRR